MNKAQQWIVTLGALGCALSSPPVSAQQAEPAQPKTQQSQTAEGAQKFLATLVRKGGATAWFIDAQGRTNYVLGKARKTTTHVGALFGDDKKESDSRVEKQLGAFNLTEIDIQGPDGKPDACMTQLTKWSPSEQLTETQNWQTTDEGILIDTPILHEQTSTYQLSPELLGPHWIDWRNVKLARTPQGTQMIASFKEKNYTAHLSFGGESALIDRVEYAMKFLKLSCDDTATTGF